MKIIKKFQEGGAVPVEAMPQKAPQQDPLMMLAQMSAQALQEGNCEIAMQVCEAFVQLVKEAQAQAAGPVAPEQGGAQPVMKNGGKIAYWKK